MKHYVKLDEQQVTDEVMAKLAGRLGSKPPAKPCSEPKAG